LALIALSCPTGPIEPQVDEAQAVAIAERQVLFDPESVESEILTTQDPPVWQVKLRGRLPGQSVFEFEETTVTVDAVSGDVVGVE
jgi:hypothetical protein